MKEIDLMWVNDGEGERVRGCEFGVVGGRRSFVFVVWNSLKKKSEFESEQKQKYQQRKKHKKHLDVIDTKNYKQKTLNIYSV